jgi:hypothetical protein
VQTPLPEDEGTRCIPGRSTTPVSALTAVETGIVVATVAETAAAPALLVVAVVVAALVVEVSPHELTECDARVLPLESSEGGEVKSSLVSASTATLSPLPTEIAALVAAAARQGPAQCVEDIGCGV